MVLTFLSIYSHLHKAFSVYQSCTNYVPIFIKIRENI
nr:MAG TPA: hypothetical protein [Caudoviricetes sp.]